MSNSLAIATVTATLSSLMGRAAQAVSGTDVTNLRPGSPTPPAINVYLFQILPNAALRNHDLPGRTSNGDLLQRPQAAFDLRYIFSFFGDDATLEPQRLLGSAVSVLHTYPLLSRELIRQVIDTAVAGNPAHFLGPSNLDEQIEAVRIAPLSFNLDDLSKLWSVFFQVPYALSVVYQVSVVLIEESLSPQRGLPVRVRGLQALPINQPEIMRVIANAGADQPILAGSDVLIQGKRLKGATTRVLFGDLEVTPTEANLADEQIRVSLPGTLKAGVQGAQVAHLLTMGEPPTAHRGFNSNVAAFVLQPDIQHPGGVYALLFGNRVVAGDGTLSGRITAQLTPDVGAQQKVTLLLNPFQPAVPPGKAYTFDAERRTIDGDTVEFLIAGVIPGNYLVRVQVDGAESPLVVDTVSGSPTEGMYIQPRIAIV